VAVDGAPWLSTIEEGGAELRRALEAERLRRERADSLCGMQRSRASSAVSFPFGSRLARSASYQGGSPHEARCSLLAERQSTPGPLSRFSSTSDAELSAKRERRAATEPPRPPAVSRSATFSAGARRGARGEEAGRGGEPNGGYAVSESGSHSGRRGADARSARGRRGGGGGGGGDGGGDGGGGDDDERADGSGGGVGDSFESRLAARGYGPVAAKTAALIRDSPARSSQAAGTDDDSFDV
jgi:hypothetical protein